MHSIQINTKTSTEITFNGKNIYEVLSDIADICHEGIMQRSVAYDDNFDDANGNPVSIKVIKDTAYMLDAKLYEILNLLGD